MDNPPLTQNEINEINRIVNEDYEMLVILS